MIITGSSSTRLPELRKYAITNVFEEQYFGNGSATNDGIDYSISPSIDYVVYYLGGIRYLDEKITTGTEPFTATTFSFIAKGINSPDFIHAPIYKDPKRENIISLPKINDDVFIVRQTLSVFEQNYRLEYVKNLVDLLTYAGGNYFNIIDNT